LVTAPLTHRREQVRASEAFRPAIPLERSLERNEWVLVAKLSLFSGATVS
jgi:hypothetical protein